MYDEAFDDDPNGRPVTDTTVDSHDRRVVWFRPDEQAAS